MIRILLRLLGVALVVLLTACSAITKVEGDQPIGARLAVKLPQAWNRVAVMTGEPYELWTQEGTKLDQLRFWSGIRSQQQLVRLPPSSLQSGKAPRVPTFAADMRPDQIVALFEGVFSIDGSMVQVTKVEPTRFGGQAGVHFEFSMTRKADDVQLSGEGWAAVQGGELFAMTFVAPRLAFYPRLRPRAQAVMASAQIK